MKILQVEYSEVFPKEPYGVNQRYGYLAQVNEGEDDVAVRKLLVKKVRDWHLENGGLILNQHHEAFEEVAEQTTPPSHVVINLQDEKIEIAIDNAKTIEELGALRKNLPVSLNNVYMKRLNELTSKIK